MENNVFLAGTFVIEYCGEIVDIPEAHRRLETSASEGVTNYYILALDKVKNIVSYRVGPHMIARNYLYDTIICMKGTKYDRNQNYDEDQI